MALSIAGCALTVACARGPAAPALVPKPASALGEERGPAVSEDGVPQALTAPEASDWVSEDDFTVRVITDAITCTGALIAPDLVLTAHHCVAARSSQGDIVERDVTSSEVTVELGGDRFPLGEAGVRSVVSPPCGYSGGAGDLAILVLSRSLPGLPHRAVELERMPRAGDSVIPLGFGRCAGTNDGIYRKRRAATPLHVVQEGRMLLDAAICPGDSGGPALSSSTGRVVGVVSRSVMDADEATLGFTELSRLDGFRELFAAAAQVARGTSRAELPPIECPVMGGRTSQR
ncbi:MAG TPA: trypsin-like serine protease [Polyangiaceae bacterium]|nr:trypsin-like serine protease [Polyangiaceae bacterium]